MQAVHFLGIPEGDLALAQVAIYLAACAEIRRIVSGAEPGNGGGAKIDRDEPVPFHLRNAPTGAMKQWGYGAGYQHAHKFEDAAAGHGVPAGIASGTRFYEPTNRGAGAADRGAAGGNSRPNKSESSRE